MAALPMWIDFMKTALKGKKGVDPSRYAIAYSELKAGGFDKITLNFDAQVPKDEDAPFVAGAMTVALETSGDKPSAKVLNVTARKE